jgi:hypothetical protein
MGFEPIKRARNRQSHGAGELPQAEFDVDTARTFEASVLPLEPISVFVGTPFTGSRPRIRSSLSLRLPSPLHLTKPIFKLFRFPIWVRATFGIKLRLFHPLFFFFTRSRFFWPRPLLLFRH